MPPILFALALIQAPAATPNSVAELVERGLRALAANQLEEAEVAFSAAARLEPGDARLRYELGEVLARRGKPADAIAQLRRAIALAPNEPQAYARLAVLQAQLQRFHDAQETLTALERARPDYAETHFLRGRIAEEEGDHARAEAHLRHYLRLKPQDVVGLGELGVALLAQEKYDEAEPLFQQVLARRPESGVAHYNLGLLGNRRGEHEKARAHLEAAARLLPEDAGVQYQLGTSLARLGELAKAEEALRKAVALAPDNLEALYALGTLLSRMGRSKEGSALLTEHERRSAAALDHRQRARRVAAFHNDVRQLLEQDRLEDADAKLREILALDPANDLAYYRRGQILFLRREYQAALASAQAASERKRFEPAYHFLEALCWERLGQDDKAAAAYERVIGLADYADAYAALARLAVKHGETERALAHLRRAVELEPADVELRLALADVLEKTGNLEEARKQRAEAEARRARTTRP
ncbi:MAG TPA: tetratricopeptide repeat protein [Candidatus Xenobia bacterium]|nr:tetratricopeptide repeat protein [Candidatus Xenobia bacterium]